MEKSEGRSRRRIRMEGRGKTEGKLEWRKVERREGRRRRTGVKERGKKEEKQVWG